MNTNKRGFYSTVWNKYLPVIRILLKKTSADEQLLGMNRTDFERAGATNKSGYRFTVNFVNGRPDSFFSANDLIQSFITCLQSDEIINEQLAKNNYTFSFTGKYELHIKNNGLTERAEASQVLTEEENAGSDEA